MNNSVAPAEECDKEPKPMEIADREPLSNEFACQEAAEKLAAGLLALYQPKLLETKQKLLELTTKQRGLIDEMQEENRKLSEAHCAEAIQEMFNKIKLYQAKLAGIKKEMAYISDKSSKMKKRALKLQQAKQREDLQRKHQRERRLLREQELIAKPSASSTKDS
ncbi:biogenesis of lysosome-related organelles complex 1 subunit 6-like [Bacillus rossius redtenbacheri]|uniref:biogenesis of lysosome-related organelles complex 1 subunit 6-like n=1 Tax=Bacillus rossius redtenbacheri TaxID=93214 RepID=UPI002FDD4C99